MRFQSKFVTAWFLILCAVLAGCSTQEEAPPVESSSPVTADSTLALRQRVAWLEANRTFGAGELFEATHHADARVRLAATVALGRIQDAAAAPTLIARLDDSDPQVVVQAAWALRQLRGLDEATRHLVQSALIQQIDLVSMPESWIYLDALTQHGGPATARILRTLVASGLLADAGSDGRPPRVEGMAALALAAIDDEVARKALSGLGSLLNRRGEATWRIAWAFSSAPDSAYFASAHSLLEHSDPYARAAGARALEDIGMHEATEHLLHTLADFDWEVRAAVLRALGEVGGEEAISYCISMLSDRHALVREAALRALLQLGTGEYLRLLEEVTADPVPAVRLLACELVATEGSVEQRLAVWSQCRRDPVDFVRSDALQFAVRALGETDGVDSLLAALRDGTIRDRTQSAAALSTLEKLPEGERRTRVRRALEVAVGDTDYVVATNAAEALGTLGMVQSLAVLQHTWETLPRSHQNKDVRLGIVSAAAALAENKPAGAESALEEFLELATRDDDPRVVQLAQTGLAHLSGDAPPEPIAPHAKPLPTATETPIAIDLGQVRVRLTTNAGTALLELDGDRYPRTVGAFLQHIDSGLHDNGVFHRVVPAFVVQGGCPRGDGWGDAGSALPCEYGNLRYDQEGIVGMAHAGKDTGGTQFFIAHGPIPRLDGRYTAFGRVIEGMDVIDRIVRGDHFKLERVAGSDE